MWQPTEAQRELIEREGSSFVEACPGSGKTKSIVARYERLTATKRRQGVALLSFTNSAVDEVTGRCSDPRMLGPPNFVGTFDSFINRFITGPYVATERGLYPRFIDSWASITGATVRTYRMSKGLEFKLDWFDWNEAGSFTLDQRLVSGRYRNPLLKAYAGESTAIDAAAISRVWQIVCEQHIISCVVSRRVAMRLLSDACPDRRWRKLLSYRFAEVIIDEAQDCGREELQVLQCFVDEQVDVTVVADMDQAIYEFRRSKPGDVRTFASRIPKGTPLTGNFRSSPTICTAGGILRFGASRDVAVGPNKTISWPVQVVEFSTLGEVAAALRTLLESHGMTTDDCKVLAHRRSDAAGAAGATASNSTGGTKVLRIARAHLVLRADPNPVSWHQAIAETERMLAEVASSSDSTDLDHVATLAERLGVSSRWLRSASLRLLHGVKPEIGRDAYALELRRIIKGLDWPISVKLTNLGKKLATPAQTQWDELAIDPPVSIPYGTIHSAKGQEFDAVALVVPQQLVSNPDGKTCLDLWDEGLDGESRRVLYVGVTRARRLLIVAVHTSHADRVRSLLLTEQNGSSSPKT